MRVAEVARSRPTEGVLPMWSALKSMPAWAKVLLVILVLGVIFKANNVPNPVGNDDHGSNFAPLGSQSLYRNGEQSAPDAGQNQGQLQSLQAQYSQVQSQAYQCKLQSDQTAQQQQYNIMQGNYTVLPPPPCAQNFPQWTATMAQLEKEIYVLQTGNTGAQVRDFVPGLGNSSSSPSYYSPSDDGTNAVERYSRQGIRGNTRYTDQNGDQYEEPTNNYYFRDRASGAIVGSDLPNPPDYNHDYEQLTPEQ